MPIALDVFHLFDARLSTALYKRALGNHLLRLSRKNTICKDVLTPTT